MIQYDNYFWDRELRWTIEEDVRIYAVRTALVFDNFWIMWTARTTTQLLSKTSHTSLTRNKLIKLPCTHKHVNFSREYCCCMPHSTCYFLLRAHGCQCIRKLARTLSTVLTPPHHEQGGNQWWCLTPQSHQTFCPVLAAELLGIMLRNRCWFITFSHHYNQKCLRMVP